MTQQSGVSLSSTENVRRSVSIKETGWPSFTEPIPAAVETVADDS
jgi:peptide methionine sulfoxide reductase MsrB